MELWDPYSHGRKSMGFTGVKFSPSFRSQLELVRGQPCTIPETNISHLQTLGGLEDEAFLLEGLLADEFPVMFVLESISVYLIVRLGTRV